jgi:hypothetical protein
MSSYPKLQTAVTVFAPKFVIETSDSADAIKNKLHFILKNKIFNQSF